MLTEPLSQTALASNPPRAYFFTADICGKGPRAPNPEIRPAQVDGSGTPPLNPALPKSVRPVLKSPPLLQSFDIVFVSIVTAAFLAIARPQMIDAPVVRVML